MINRVPNIKMTGQYYDCINIKKKEMLYSMYIKQVTNNYKTHNNSEKLNYKQNEQRKKTN